MTEPKLFIPAEKDAMFTPHTDQPAVVEGLVYGQGAQTDLVITAPARMIADFKGPTPFYDGRMPHHPNWLEVDADYAGKPRLISYGEYLALWRQRWFKLGGYEYQPEKTIRLHTGVTVQMQRLWNVYSGLRDFIVRYPDDFAWLAHAATHPDKRDELPEHRLPRDLRESLTVDGTGETFTERGLQLIKNLVGFNSGLRHYELVDPWPEPPQAV